MPSLPATLCANGSASHEAAGTVSDTQLAASFEIGSASGTRVDPVSPGSTSDESKDVIKVMSELI